MTKVDPRFIRAGKQKSKVVVDERFQSMFEDEEFVKPVTVDKYGREVQTDLEKKVLQDFYRLERDETAEDDKGKEKASCSSSSSDSDESEEEDSSEDSESNDFVMDEALSSHPLVVRDVPQGSATNRLAIVNLDWDQITADDIFTILYGFKPPTGVIKSVSIYPSQFGKERLAREAVEGPSRELFVKENEEEEEGESEHESENEVEESNNSSTSSDELSVEDDGEDFDSVALRKYQLERLRYYYAVVECDSTATASYIYRHCDGAEFEKSANFLDLRFIPDNVTFSPEIDKDGPLKDFCDALPAKYNPKPELLTSALQKSKVALTWDADDAERVRLTRKPQNMDNAETDLNAYLASATGSDTENEAEAGLASKYRSLLLSGANEAGKVFGNKQARSDEEDLEITFASALAEKDQDAEDDVHMEASFDVSEFVSDNEEDEGDNTSDDDENNKDKTPFQKYLDKRKAKKQARKDSVKEAKEKPKETKTQKDKRIRQERAEARKEQAKLSHLINEDEVSDDEDAARLIRKSLKKSKTSKAPVSVVANEIDLHDERFAAVYEEPTYALDPSHPSFKRTESMQKIIKERQRRLTTRK